MSVLILMGGPGAGKGTQAKRLAEYASLAHISTGDLFRENIGKGTELGKRAKSFTESGKLVPDGLVLDMLFERVAQPDCERGYILDGFPRTLPQARALDARLGEEQASVLEIRVSDEVIVARIAGRLLCRQCDNIQHAEFNPPAKPGVCDACGGELHQRKDDSSEVVQARLNVYHEQTAPVLKHYADRGTLESVDGEQTPDEVFAALCQFVPGQEVV
jgi:adenylate kinase